MATTDLLLPAKKKLSYNILIITVIYLTIINNNKQINNIYFLLLLLEDNKINSIHEEQLHNRENLKCRQPTSRSITTKFVTKRF